MDGEAEAEADTSIASRREIYSFFSLYGFFYPSLIEYISLMVFF